MSAESAIETSQAYGRVAAAIRYLQAHHLDQPTLSDVAAVMALSESRAQRLFTSLAGISPKRFLQHLNGLRGDRLLREGSSVLAASYATGLSGPGRLHDLMVSVDAAAPGEVAAGGAGLNIAWSVQPSPFGSCFVAVTGRGICGLHFLDPMTVAEALAETRARWPGAHFTESPHSTGAAVRRAFGTAAEAQSGPLSLFVSGTNFQLQVWRALLRIPPGRATTYSAIAREMGAPAAARAVGAAVGCNPVALLIPCHRVIRQDGGLGGYHWDAGRKHALLAWESARAAQQADDPESAVGTQPAGAADATEAVAPVAPDSP
jgi:AraC family transcriptional regulator, regulatory protein of adaptative response / methylated-DNA-[protein]-cysteine methyltransferase